MSISARDKQKSILTLLNANSKVRWLFYSAETIYESYGAYWVEIRKIVMEKLYFSFKLLLF